MYNAFNFGEIGKTRNGYYYINMRPLVGDMNFFSIDTVFSEINREEDNDIESFDGFSQTKRVIFALVLSDLNLFSNDSEGQYCEPDLITNSSARIVDYKMFSDMLLIDMGNDRDDPDGFGNYDPYYPHPCCGSVRFFLESDKNMDFIFSKSWFPVVYVMSEDSKDYNADLESIAGIINTHIHGVLAENKVSLSKYLTHWGINAAAPDKGMLMYEYKSETPDISKVFQNRFGAFEAATTLEPEYVFREDYAAQFIEKLPSQYLKAIKFGALSYCSMSLVTQETQFISANYRRLFEKELMKLQRNRFTGKKMKMKKNRAFRRIL